MFTISKLDSCSRFSTIHSHVVCIVITLLLVAVQFGQAVAADDTWNRKARLQASDAESDDEFGWAVAIDGNTAVVGARSVFIGGSQTGAAYVFEKTAGGWTQTAKLTPDTPVGDVNQVFGQAVAISGDTIVVGDTSYYNPGNSAGAAYVFVRPANGWTDMTQTAFLTTSEGIVTGDQFGHSVAIDGDTVVVGSYYDDGLRGSAYVYKKPGSGWADMTETAKLTAATRVAGDQFGSSVAIDGDTIVAGATSDNPTADDREAAYVFVKPGSGWANATETAKLQASDRATPFDDLFGTSVAINGDTVVVGAMKGDGTVAGSGAAYVFVKPGSGWANATETAKLTASDGAAATDQFGISVAVKGPMIVVGAPYMTVSSTVAAGAAYVFTKPGSGWATKVEDTRLSLNGDATFLDNFGNSVAIGNRTIIAGTPFDDLDTPNSNYGAAYIFENPFPWVMFIPKKVQGGQGQ